MKQLTIENMLCHDADEVGCDELRLEVICDGEVQSVSETKITGGDQWALDREVLFSRSCTVRLAERASPPSEARSDVVGVVEIKPENTHRGVAHFTKGTANYSMTYSVTDRRDLQDADWAAELFERSAVGGLWGAIEKNTLMTDIRQRRHQAESINQAKSSFCGPTSIVYELARTQPQRYVELCRQLYETGGLRTRSDRIEASETLRSSAVGQGMKPADWMLIATLRNSRNRLFKVGPSATGILRGLQGMTFPWEVKTWAEEILLKDDVAIKTCVFFGEVEALREAQRVYDEGGSAFLLINLAVLKSEDRFIPPYPDHWVVFQGNLDTSDIEHRIGFDVYTWGRIMRLDLSRKRFERSTYCVVTAS